MENTSILGRGWSFPPTFDKRQKSVVTTADEEDVRKSLHILLSTRLGERIMQPTYGCALDEMLFESLNTGIITYIKNIVETAILHHEPRIDLESVNLDRLDPSSGRIDIEVTYTIRTTNSRFNYVYPFYLNEGTNIQ